jgi:putative membrane protein
MPADPARFDVTPSAGNHFAWLRTRMAVDRTLMAWVRTATALIGFGFTIVQFFERLGGMENVAVAARPQMPRYLGLALIAAGVIALLISSWQYRVLVNHLWSGPFKALAGFTEKRLQAPVYFVAIGLIFIGVFAFVAILTRAL